MSFRQQMVVFFENVAKFRKTGHTAISHRSLLSIFMLLRSNVIIIHEAGGVEAGESAMNVQGHCSGRQAAVAAGKISLTDQDPPTLFLCQLPPEPEKKAAILAGARFIHPGRTMITKLFSPYTI